MASRPLSDVTFYAVTFRHRLRLHRGTKGILLIFQIPERYNQEVLSHSFICLPLPYMEGIVSICNIDLYCVIAIFNGTGDMFHRWHFYTLKTNWGNKSSPRSLTLWVFTPNMHSPISAIQQWTTQNCKQTAMSNRRLTVNKEQWATWS